MNVLSKFLTFPSVCIFIYLCFGLVFTSDLVLDEILRHVPLHLFFFFSPPLSPPNRDGDGDERDQCPMWTFPTVRSNKLQKGYANTDSEVRLDLALVFSFSKRDESKINGDGSDWPIQTGYKYLCLFPKLAQKDQALRGLNTKQLTMLVSCD